MTRIGSRTFELAVVACVLLAPGVVVAQGTTQANNPVQRQRASWFSDRRAFRVGDLIMVVVDERVAAKERSSRVASGSREQSMDLSAAADQLGISDTELGFSTGLDRNSRNVGEANRQGDLTAFLGVRVMAMDANGNLEIQGERSVEVDGRTQQITVTGIIRAEDVSASNVVLSSRIADAVISYEGKDIGPSSGILGKLLSIFWP